MKVEGFLFLHVTRKLKGGDYAGITKKMAAVEGIEATYRLRESTGLSRKTAMVSVVGSSFTLGRGIDARLLAQ
jgi:hypothetical protein